MKASKRCAVTGGTGYVGSCIKTFLAGHGFEVYELSRYLVTRSSSRVPYRLPDPVDEEALADVDVLIHCAYDFHPIVWSDIVRINVEGSTRLFEAAKAAGVQTIIAISSMSAFPGCRSFYGRAKLAIEAGATEHGAVILRPGLVFGRRAGGVLGALIRATSRKIVPLIGRGDHVLYLAHEEDLCRLVLHVCLQPAEHVGSPITAASEKGKTLRTVLETLARATGNTPVLIPVPWQLAWGGLFLAEKMGVKVSFRSDGLISLLNRNPDPDFGSTRSTGVRFREFNLESLLE